MQAHPATTRADEPSKSRLDPRTTMLEESHEEREERMVQERSTPAGKPSPLGATAAGGSGSSSSGAAAQPSKSSWDPLCDTDHYRWVIPYAKDPRRLGAGLRAKEERR